MPPTWSRNSAPRSSRAFFRKRNLHRVPAELFQKYFRPADGAPGTPGPGQFQVVDEVRSRIEFTRHDLLSLVPVRQDLSLIVCKNVLLHFDERQRCDVLRMFHGALRKDGLLVMEHTQKVPEALRPLLEQVAPHAQVYRKIDVPAVYRLDSGAADRVGLPARQAPAAPRFPPPSTVGRLTQPPANPPRDVFAGPGPATPPNFLPN